MKRTLLSVAFLITTACANAQPVFSLVGTWQGTLPIVATGQGDSAFGLRMVFTIEKNPNGSLHGAMTLIDRGTSVPLSSVAFSAPNVTFSASDAPIFRGKLSGNGDLIAGIWTAQGSQSTSLNLLLATADTLWKPARTALQSMAGNADPSFDVATIKLTPPNEQQTLFDLHSRKFTAQHTSAAELIKIAYNIRGRQVLNAPSLDNTKYDIVAEPDTPGMPSEAQVRVMVRKLLTERFHLVSHTSTQEFPALALTLDPKGPPPVPVDPGLAASGGMASRRDGDDVLLQFSATTIHDFLAWIMNNYQDKALVDETGLTGTYNITLRIPISSLQPTPNGPPSDDFGHALVLATDLAGFKFVSRRESLPVVIVDHIDPPTPN